MNLTGRSVSDTMEMSRQSRGVLLLTPSYTQFGIVGKAPFTRIRPVCLDSDGAKTREGRFAMPASKPCEICGTHITGKPSAIAKRRFCSIECATEWRRRTQHGSNNNGWKGGKATFVCQQCGEEFESYKSTNQNKYCSTQCYHAAKGHGRKYATTCKECGATFETYPSVKARFCSRKCASSHANTQVELTCEECGKTFKVKKGIAKKTRFCSKPCKGAWFSRNHVGPKAPGWKGGTSRLPYAYDFRRKRIDIRERDNHTCAVCSKPGHSVHHIDYDKTNTSASNLITLCKRCHSRTNGNRSYWQTLFTSMMEGKPCYRMVQLKLL